jgi:hypothetical protein
MPAPARERQTVPQRPLSEVVGSVVAEIRQMAALVDDFHAMPAPRIDGGTVDPAFIRQMQTVDRVSQRLNGLADFLGALRHAMPAEWRLDVDDALSIVKLHHLALQLGLPDQSGDVPDEPDDCTFF